jgi:hypothetical protein
VLSPGSANCVAAAGLLPLLPEIFAATASAETAAAVAELSMAEAALRALESQRSPAAVGAEAADVAPASCAAAVDVLALESGIPAAAASADAAAADVLLLELELSTAEAALLALEPELLSAAVGAAAAELPPAASSSAPADVVPPLELELPAAADAGPVVPVAPVVWRAVLALVACPRALLSAAETRRAVLTVIGMQIHTTHLPYCSRRWRFLSKASGLTTVSLSSARRRGSRGTSTGAAYAPSTTLGAWKG